MSCTTRSTAEGCCQIRGTQPVIAVQCTREARASRYLVGKPRPLACAPGSSVMPFPTPVRTIPDDDLLRVLGPTLRCRSIVGRSHLGFGPNCREALPDAA